MEIYNLIQWVLRGNMALTKEKENGGIKMKDYREFKGCRLPIITTMEMLECDMTGCCGSIVRYNGKIIVAITNYKGEVIGMIYDPMETEEETGLSYIECRISLSEVAEQTFKDTGHAIAWGLKMVA